MELKRIRLPFKSNKSVLALGSQTKNTTCFLKNQDAFIGPVHQNLANPDDLVKFEKGVKYFLKNKPQVIAYDLHPEYQSTKYIEKLSDFSFKFQAIQHHHAHIASCMAENNLKNQKVIGVAFDGTGLGNGNQIWGAEFLVCDYKNFKRKAHLREIPLVGQEAAILEPWRLTATWLYRLYRDKFLGLNIGFAEKINKNKWQVLKKMYLVNFNSPLASSMGRLFDAVASLVLEKYRANFEAELAIALEKLAAGHRPQGTNYRFELKKAKGIYIIDPALMFKDIISDIKKQITKEEIAYRFHLTVAKMIAKVSVRLRKETGIKKVVLSGGVFQNKLLLKLTLDLLYKHKFSVFIHKNLPPNDANISLGQAAIASFR